MSILPKNGIGLQKKPNLHFTSRNVVGEMAQRRSMFSFFVHKTSGFFKFLLSLHTGVGFDVLWFSVVLKMNF